MPAAKIARMYDEYAYKTACAGHASLKTAQSCSSETHNVSFFCTFSDSSPWAGRL